MATNITTWLTTKKDAAPLAVFRIFFALMVLISLIRFASYGWIDKLYIQPAYFFSYYGLEWIQPLGMWTYGLYILCAIASIGVVLGYRYRLSATLLFLSWTYIELMDKTHYLNHYYAISLIALLMVWLPAAANYSLDVSRHPQRSSRTVPAWTIYSMMVMIGGIYFFAGIAKINSDWLLAAQPLKMWLPSKYDTPLIGRLLEHGWVAYAFSWCGMLFDVLIPFCLLSIRIRPFAFTMLVVFHLLTWVLFPIGIFPFVMIGCATIFFSARWHQDLLARLPLINRLPTSPNQYIRTSSKVGGTIVSLIIIYHLVMPMRYLLYPSPGDLFWTEYGFRYSWRVMLMEKAGYASFTVVDRNSSRRYTVDNDLYLTPIQQKQMATQADFMIAYAHYLADVYAEQYDLDDPAVYVDSRVALNGRRSQPYVRSDIDLTDLCDHLSAQDLYYDYQR
jgi:hypothetical protein